MARLAASITHSQAAMAEAVEVTVRLAEDPAGVADPKPARQVQLSSPIAPPSGSDPGPPRLSSLRHAIKDAQAQINALLTEEKDRIGEAEKAKERDCIARWEQERERKRLEKKQAAAANGDESDEDEEEEEEEG